MLGYGLEDAELFDRLLSKGLEQQIFFQEELYGAVTHPDFMVCLSAFQSLDGTENSEQREERAFEMLEQIQQEIADDPDVFSLAKWGCLVECLVQNSFVEADLDELLAETDDYLISLWQKMNGSYVDISPLFIWLGDYFLFRFCDEQSQYCFRSFQILEQMVSSIEQFFHIPSHSTIRVEPVFLFPTVVWQDIEWWLVRINESCVCKSARRVLENLYTLRDSDVLLHSNSPKNALRWKFRNLYFSKQ